VSRERRPGPRTQALVALCGAALVLFNFPMLVIWDRDATVFGLPLLPVALFGIWAGLIALLAWASERGGGG
jgi:hypothetical protein